MPTIARVLGGQRAHNAGRMFEALLQHEARRNGWAAIRIPDGCKQVGKNKLIRIRSPFDYVFTKNGMSIFVDAKTTSQTAFNHGNLTIHQLIYLKEQSEAGAKAGYVVFFNKTDQIIFFSVEKLIRLRSQESLKPEDGIFLGNRHSIILDQIIKLPHP